MTTPPAPPAPWQLIGSDTSVLQLHTDRAIHHATRIQTNGTKMRAAVGIGPLKAQVVDIPTWDDNAQCYIGEVSLSWAEFNNTVPKGTMHTTISIDVPNKGGGIPFAGAVGDGWNVIKPLLRGIRPSSHETLDVTEVTVGKIQAANALSFEVSYPWIPNQQVLEFRTRVAYPTQNDASTVMFLLLTTIRLSKPIKIRGEPIQLSEAPWWDDLTNEEWMIV